MNVENRKEKVKAFLNITKFIGLNLLRIICLKLKIDVKKKTKMIIIMIIIAMEQSITHTYI